MDINKVSALFFSPTGGTKRIAERAAAGIRDEYVSIDITVNSQELNFGPDEVVVIAAPVFGGRVPTPVRERLSHVRAQRIPAVILVVYGNREYEDALLELRKLAENCGFDPVAAGAFIARHSIAPEIGAGRPDAADMAVLDRFSAAARERIEWVAPVNDLPTVIVPGNSKFRDFDGLPIHPAANRAKCGKCGKCASECPVGAIPASDPTKTDAKKCITCMRCVSVCPHYARSLNPIMLSATKARLRKSCSVRKTPETFL